MHVYQHFVSALYLRLSLFGDYANKGKIDLKLNKGWQIRLAIYQCKELGKAFFRCTFITFSSFFLLFANFCSFFNCKNFSDYYLLPPTGKKVHLGFFAL